MGFGKTLKNEITEWGILAMVIVIVTVIILKFKDVSGVTAGLNTTIDAFATALSEPKNWVAIVIIAIIGWGLVSYFKGKGK